MVHRGEAPGQRRRRRARIEMRLARKKQRLVEAAGEIGLQRCDLRRADALALAREALETRELRAIARGGENQRAMRRRDRHDLGPVAQRFDAKFDDERLRALFLAPGRDHAAGKMRAAEARPLAALDDFDMAARAGELISGREARDAGADDPDAHRHGRRPPGSA